MSAEESDFPNAHQTIVVADGEGLAAIDYYEKSMSAKADPVYKNKDGTVMHSMLKSTYGFMFSVEECTPKEHNTDPVKSPSKRGVANYTYVNVQKPHTCDEAIENMRKAGAHITHEAHDTFYGHRVGRCVDKYGAAWAFATTIPVEGEMEWPEKWGH